MEKRISRIPATIEVHVPSGEVMVAKEIRIGPRVPDLNGKTIGLVWNEKEHGDAFMGRLGELLRGRFPQAKILRFNKSFRIPWTAELLADVKGKCNAVVMAVGD